MKLTPKIRVLAYQMYKERESYKLLKNALLREGLIVLKRGLNMHISHENRVIECLLLWKGGLKNTDKKNWKGVSKFCDSSKRGLHQKGVPKRGGGGEGSIGSDPDIENATTLPSPIIPGIMLTSSGMDMTIICLWLRSDFCFGPGRGHMDNLYLYHGDPHIAFVELKRA